MDSLHLSQNTLSSDLQHHLQQHQHNSPYPSHQYQQHSSPYTATLPPPQLSAYLRHHHSLLPHHHRLSTTCIPSLIPPGMDPGQVDMRTFFPYQPNEVKHRKRTTRSQLKVLEDVYKYDTKPNATLRKKLAEELGMTPRGVQVWFQNRRAKTKSQARKADAAKNQNPQSLTTHDRPTPSSPPDEDSSQDLDDSDTAIDSDLTAPTITESDETQSISSGSNTITHSPTINTVDSIDRESAPSPVRITASNTASTTVDVTGPSMQDDHSFWTHPNPFASSSTPTPSNGGPSSNSMPSTPDPPSLLCVPDPLLAQRRPSLPIIVSPPSSSPSSLGLGGINGVSQQSYHQLPQFHHRASMGAVGLVSNGVRNAGAPYNPIHRRRSVDTNMMRLSYHPYAHLAQHANANIYGGVPPHVNPPPPSGNHLGSPYDAARMRHGSMPHVFEGVPQQNSLGISPHQAYFPGPNRRPGIPTRMSMPALMHQQQHQQQQHHQSQDYSTSNPSFGPHVQVSPPPTITSSGSSYEFPSISTNNPAASAPGNGNSQPPSPSTSSPPSNISYTQIQQQHDCAMVYSSREVHKPIPGPLPEANFSFGNPNLSGTTSVHSTPPTVQGQESEDDGTTSVGTGSSYDMHGSRFGSLASVASIGSESSFTSAYYSTEEGACDESLGQGFHPDMRRASVASGHLSEMFNGLDVNGTGGQVTTTPHIDVRRASSSSSGGSAPISPVHDGSSSNANHIAGNNGLNGNEPFSSPASTISAGSHKAIAVPQVNEMAVYGYHQGSADDGSVGMSGDSSPTLMYPPPHGDSSRNANGGNGNTLDGVVTFTNPFNTETTYDTSSGYGSGFTGMDDSSMVVGGSDQGGGGGGGAGTLYGAIELSHMCVPANMGAMGGFGMTESFMPYS